MNTDVLKFVYKGHNAKDIIQRCNLNISVDELVMQVKQWRFEQAW